MLCNGLIADWSEWFYQRSSQSAGNAFGYLEEVVPFCRTPPSQSTARSPKESSSQTVGNFPPCACRMGACRIPIGQLVCKPHRHSRICWSGPGTRLDAGGLGKRTTDRIMLLVDEVEAHLHPKWQRTILPAILRVVQKLQPDISVQVLAATHSPLVLASVEPHFDEEQISSSLSASTPASREQDGTFDALPWAVHGDVVGWLTSDVFGLEQARSRGGTGHRGCGGLHAGRYGEPSRFPDDEGGDHSGTAAGSGWTRSVLAPLDRGGEVMRVVLGPWSLVRCRGRGGSRTKDKNKDK